MGQYTVLVHSSDFKINLHNFVSKYLHSETGDNWLNGSQNWDTFFMAIEEMTT